MTQQSISGSGLEGAIPPEEAVARLRRDAVENRRRILEIARRLFAESGVEAVSMHRVAQAAGVGQATMYRHYINKGELCRDLIADTVERSAAELETYLRESTGQPALERLDHVLLRIVTFIEDKLSYLAAIGDACAGENRTSKFNLPGYRWLHGMLTGLLNEAQEEGAISVADITFTADAILAAISPDMYQFEREERGLTREQIVHRVRSLYT